MMKSFTRAAATVLAVGALLVTGSPAHAQGVWTAVPSPNEFGSDVMFGVDASDAGHVWAVGRVIIRNVEFRSRIYRHDGTAWRTVTLSGVTSQSELSAVDAVSGTEAWAAGTSYPASAGSTTLVARWNGSTWAREPTPNGSSSGSSDLTGVAASGGTVWAVGSHYAPGAGQRALILQRSGGVWRRVSAPRVQATEFLNAVDATGPADAWAVGWGTADITSAPGVPIVLRWNGIAWQSMSLPVTGSTVLYGVEALTPTNVWAVGRTYSSESGEQPYIAHFNGSSWRRVATPTLMRGGPLKDVVALSASNIIAVGTGGNGGAPIVLHWNGSSWTQEASPDTLNLAGAAAVGPSTFWAVGDGFDLGAYANKTFTMVRR